MKVSEIQYERFTKEQMSQWAESILQALRTASLPEVLHAREEYVKWIAKFTTASSLAYMRFTLNTTDEFYLKEKDYYDEITPTFEDYQREFAQAMLQLPFRRELEDALLPLLFRLFESQEKAVSPAILDDMVEENKLTTEYAKLMSDMTFLFHEEQMPLPMLRRYMQEDDRNTRREAYLALGTKLSEQSEKLDGLYDRLVGVRDSMAKKMGYENYVALGYYRMSRISFDRDMIGKFRQNVLRHLVPAVERLKKELARRMGIDTFMLYDNDVNLPGGNPKPVIDKDGIFLAARKMYKDMGDITGDFFDMMLRNKAFDVDSRANKWGGGYCINLPCFNQPFILANFNGTADDIGVITHEAGHALADYLTSGNRFALDLPYGNETAEVHSMSMEFLTWNHMDLFFGTSADKYRFCHLIDALTFIPYGTMVDHFQHIMYEHPELTPAQRKATWNDLEAQYRPYLSTQGMPYLSEGTRWQYQMHIYESPFYYIDYCLAQVVALQFLIESRKDHAAAFEKYLCFVKHGGEMRFTDLIAEAGLDSPFEEETILRLAADIESLVHTLWE